MDQIYNIIIDWQTLFTWLLRLPYSGCQNISHQQQIFSELPSPGWSHKYNYSLSSNQPSISGTRFFEQTSEYRKQKQNCYNINRILTRKNTTYVYLITFRPLGRTISVKKNTPSHTKPMQQWTLLRKIEMKWRLHAKSNNRFSKKKKLKTTWHSHTLLVLHIVSL